MDKYGETRQSFNKRYQSKLLIAILGIVTAGVSSYADRSISSDLHIDGRAIFDMGLGMHGPYDPYLFYVPPYLGHRFYNPCHPFVSCAAFHQYQLMMQRQQRSQKMRDQQKVFGIPSLVQQQNAKYHRTDENEILPGIRGYSQIRPGYEGVGKYLPEFQEQDASTSGK